MSISGAHNPGPKIRVGMIRQMESNAPLSVFLLCAHVSAITIWFPCTSSRQLSGGIVRLQGVPRG